MIDTAIILAAGRGVRLEPLTRSMPKVLAPYMGVPVLEHTLRLLQRVGVRRVIMNACYRADDVMSFLAERKTHDDFVVEVVREPVLLGTGGALGAMKDRVDSLCYVLNGDNLIRVNLPALARAHVLGDAEATLGYLPHCGGNGGHRLTVDDHGLLKSLVRVPPIDDRQTGSLEDASPYTLPLNAGVMAVEPTFLDRFMDHPHGLEDDALPPLLAAGVAIGTVALQGEVVDLGTPRSYQLAHLDALSRPELMKPARECVEQVMGTRRRLFTDGERRAAWLLSAIDTVPQDVEVSESFVGANVHFGGSARLKRCVVLSGVTLGDGVNLTDCLIAPGCCVGDGVELSGITLSSDEVSRLSLCSTAEGLVTGSGEADEMRTEIRNGHEERSS